MTNNDKPPLPLSLPNSWTIDKRYYMTAIDWLSSVLRPLQHSIGDMGDGF